MPGTHPVARKADGLVAIGVAMPVCYGTGLDVEAARAHLLDLAVFTDVLAGLRGVRAEQRLLLTVDHDTALLVLPGARRQVRLLSAHDHLDRLHVCVCVSVCVCMCTSVCEPARVCTSCCACAKRRRWVRILYVQYSACASTAGPMIATRCMDSTHIC